MLSIAVVSYDNPDYLDLLLRGLQRNTTTDYEVLVHGNSPSEKFKSTIKKWQCVTQYTETTDNTFITPNINNLFKLASGEYFVVLDDDVYPAPGWDLALLSKANPNIFCQYMSSILFYPPRDPGSPEAIASANAYNMRSFGFTIEEFSEDDFCAQWKDSRNILEDTGGICGNFFIHRNLWEAVGGYDPEFIRGEDISFKFQVWKYAKEHHNSKYEFRAVADSCFYHFGHKGWGKAGFSAPMAFPVNEMVRKKFGGMSVMEVWRELIKGNPLHDLQTF